MSNSFQGYRRENGRVGVRNHVIVLPVDDLSNAACEAVAHNIKGTLALPHPYGRLQFGADLDLHFRTLIGTGANPNVAAVVVIGIEEQWTRRVVDGIRATGKPVAGFGIELHGDHDTIMRASKAAKEYVQWASELQRVECAHAGTKRLVDWPPREGRRRGGVYRAGMLGDDRRTAIQRTAERIHHAAQERERARHGGAAFQTHHPRARANSRQNAKRRGQEPPGAKAHDFDLEHRTAAVLNGQRIADCRAQTADLYDQAHDVQHYTLGRMDRCRAAAFE